MIDFKNSFSIILEDGNTYYYRWNYEFLDNNNLTLFVDERDSGLEIYDCSNSDSHLTIKYYKNEILNPTTLFGMKIYSIAKELFDKKKDNVTHHPLQKKLMH